MFDLLFVFLIVPVFDRIRWIANYLGRQKPLNYRCEKPDERPAWEPGACALAFRWLRLRIYSSLPRGPLVHRGHPIEEHVPMACVERRQMKQRFLRVSTRGLHHEQQPQKLGACLSVRWPVRSYQTVNQGDGLLTPAHSVWLIRWRSVPKAADASTARLLILSKCDLTFFGLPFWLSNNTSILYLSHARFISLRSFLFSVRLHSSASFCHILLGFCSTMN